MPKVLKLGTELFAWNSSPDESQRTKEGRRIENNTQPQKITPD